jgi:Tfp pilus assembly protein PilE
MMSRSELCVLGVVVSLLTVCVYPSYSEMQERTRQAEARTNLGGIFVAEMSFFADNGRYSDFDEIKFTLRLPARYTYRAMKTRPVGSRVEPGPIQVLEPTRGAVTPENTVVKAVSSATSFTATATANLDDDPTIDQWHVNEKKEGLTQADVDDVTVITDRT